MFAFVSGNLALDLAGTVQQRRTDRRDLLLEPADLARWLVEAGVLDQPCAVTPAGLTAAKELREAVYRLALTATTPQPTAPEPTAPEPVVSQLVAPEPTAPQPVVSRLAAPQPEPPEAQRQEPVVAPPPGEPPGPGARAGDREVVNRFAAVPPTRVRLDEAGRAERAGDLAAALSTVARQAVELLGGPQAVRIKECGAGTCTRLYVDTSRGRARRWCDMQECGNRAKAAGFRARHRAL
ncbi:CGNR zinc finger domain-containing protein [Nonomuraea indica]|uniref:CGNR zinc finger domain-containing protein n=1 Tax=Nonomuraea indica TaxID=1581193 RepID=UPI001FE4B4CA|nr:CGNR zinc finger domain-containing protein [Nonomuraea indica]